MTLVRAERPAGTVIFIGVVLLVVTGTILFIALLREHARREAWWRETKPSCRLLTVVSGKAFGPPRAIYECPGGVLVRRNIGD